MGIGGETQVAAQDLVALFIIFFRSIQKSKCLAPFLCTLFMMNVVGPHDPFHISVFCLVFDFYSTMDNYVMEYKIKNSVARDAYPNVQGKIKLLAHSAKKN